MRVKLNSKRHDVFLENQVIYKYYSDSDSFDTERYFLRLFDPSRLLACDESELMIKMAFIEGHTLLETISFFESSSLIEETIQLLKDVVDEIEKFHLCFHYKYRFYDMNFRNMIINTKVNLIDFETVCEGDYRLDYFDLIAMFMMYNPVESAFKRIVERNLASTISVKLKLTKDDYKKCFDESIDKIVRRRQM